MLPAAAPRPPPPAAPGPPPPDVPDAGAPVATPDAGAPPGPPSVSFLTVGDVMLSRLVAAAIEKAGDPLLPWRNVAALLGSVDFTFANLEAPISGADRFSAGPAQIFNTPRAYAQGLVEHRLRIVNLANNHALDQGLGGLVHTLAFLREHGIETIGAGPTAAQAWRPAVVEARGVRIGFVGASEASVNTSRKIWLDYVARIEDKGRLRGAIAELRQKADFVVATMHAGIEYVPRHYGPQRLFARAAIDYGADLVLGSHPHVVQDVEIYRGRYIFYSLGNFVFDHSRPHTTEAVAVKTVLRIESAGTDSGAEAGAGRRVRLDRLELVPLVIENQCCPRPAGEAEAGAILQRMGLSEPVLQPPPPAPAGSTR
ncbi:MAG: CapA family protein [Deltaproteobacteria bacterium]|nr:CapA family protein [Deltaproteobacteria bacterium]